MCEAGALARAIRALIHMALPVLGLQPLRVHLFPER